MIARGGIQLAAPAEWGLDIGGDPQSILLSALIPPGANNGVGLLAIGSHGEAQPTPPLTDERLAEWLKNLIATERPSSYSRSVVLLPAGRAVEIRATYGAGTPDATEVAAFAIPTAIGVVSLQVIIDDDLMGRYGSTLQLIPMLLDLGTARISSPAP